MSFAEKIGHFLLFVLLAIVTVGIYPLYFMIVTTRENNKYLREIRDILSVRGTNVVIDRE